jgi:hypothetical protein
LRVDCGDLRSYCFRATQGTGAPRFSLASARDFPFMAAIGRGADVGVHGAEREIQFVDDHATIAEILRGIAVPIGD